MVQNSWTWSPAETGSRNKNNLADADCQIRLVFLQIGLCEWNWGFLIINHSSIGSILLFNAYWSHSQWEEFSFSLNPMLMVDLGFTWREIMGNHNVSYGKLHHEFLLFRCWSKEIHSQVLYTGGRAVPVCVGNGVQISLLGHYICISQHIFLWITILPNLVSHIG